MLIESMNALKGILEPAINRAVKNKKSRCENERSETLLIISDG
jgi:hypothetical protein